jgi:phosphoenolpyruvate---glycerone phosphotransferase subunit DhaL
LTLSFFMSELNKSSRRLSPIFQVKFTGEALRRWMALFAESIRESEQLLTDLDAAIGDADHGTNMRRGMNAVSEKLDSLALADLSGQLRVVSTTLMSSVGGASGPLYGAFFLQSSHAALHKPELGLADLTAAMEAGLRGVVQLGKAAVGDKTMVDTLTAAVNSLRSSCNHYEALPDALKASRKAAYLAAEGTIPMVARKGRASYIGERSAGTQDPGATSAAILFETLSQSVLLTSFKPSPKSSTRLQSSLLL